MGRRLASAFTLDLLEESPREELALEFDELHRSSPPAGIADLTDEEAKGLLELAGPDVPIGESELDEEIASVLARSRLLPS
jgi:hypothetical protein